MAIELTEKIKFYGKEALEERLNVSTVADRDSLPLNERYNGIIVTVRAEGKRYELLYDGNFEALEAASKDAFLGNNDNWKIIKSGSTPDATTTVKGKIQIATKQEGISGENEDKAIVPTVLKEVLGLLKGGVLASGDTLKKLYDLITSNSDLIHDIYLILQSDSQTLQTFQNLVDFIESNRDDLDNYVLTLQNKVDKVAGKSLIDDALITKLQGIQAGAQKNPTAAEIKTMYESVAYMLSNGVAAKTATGDWNNYKDSGFYMGRELLNASPTTSNHLWRYVIVVRHNDNSILQISWDFQQGDMCTRVCVEGSWKAWQSIYNKTEVDGLLDNKFPRNKAISNPDDVIEDGYFTGRPFAENHPPGAAHGDLFAYGEKNSGMRFIFIDDQGKLLFRARTWDGNLSPWKMAAEILDPGTAQGRRTILLERIVYSGRIGFYNTDNSAQGISIRNLLVSTSYADSGKVPSDGIYSKGDIVGNGNITGVSDRRVKNNIRPIEKALERILKIRGVTYTRTDQSDKEKQHMGVIAQDLLKVVPELVEVPRQRKDLMSVNYANMTALLVEGMKEQQEQIKTLLKEVETLKGGKNAT